MRAMSFARGVRPAVLSLLMAAGALIAGQAAAVPPAEIYKRAQQEKPALIDTMAVLPGMGRVDRGRWRVSPERIQCTGSGRRHLHGVGCPAQLAQALRRERDVALALIALLGVVFRLAMTQKIDQH